MEILHCACKSNPTHKCSNCEPPEYLCLSCIKPHLIIHPNDSLISLSRTSAATTSNIPCSMCKVQVSDYLEILKNSALPICKNCKKRSSTEDPILISIKWREIVKEFKDLKEINYRKQVLQMVNEDIESLYSTGITDLTIDSMRDSLIEIIKRMAEKKKEKNRNLQEKNSEIIKKLKSDAELEILKTQPESMTEAGQLVCAAMSNSRIKKFEYQVSQSFESNAISLIQKIFDDNLVKKRKIEYYIYLFVPGKPILIKIDLVMMVKEEIVFGRNWTFQPSWQELRSKEIFICGGNGLNSTSVLIVNPESLNISIRNSFSGRTGHGLVEINNAIYAFGGLNFTLAEKYHFDSNTWESLTDLPKIIKKVSVSLLNAQILIAGMDCESIFSYCPQDNCYSDYGNLLNTFKIKSKILFNHEGFLYCLSGNKLFYLNLENNEEWRTAEVVDGDWWSNTQPVIYNNCAYFIHYVSDLWKLNLQTFELVRIIVSELSNSQ